MRPPDDTKAEPPVVMVVALIRPPEFTSISPPDTTVALSTSVRSEGIAPDARLCPVTVEVSAPTATGGGPLINPVSAMFAPELKVALV